MSALTIICILITARLIREWNIFTLLTDTVQSVCNFTCIMYVMNMKNIFNESKAYAS